MDSVKYLRHAAAIGGSNTDNDDYFCPVTIRRAFEIAQEIEELRAQVEALSVIRCPDGKMHQWDVDGQWTVAGQCRNCGNHATALIDKALREGGV